MGGDRSVSRPAKPVFNVWLKKNASTCLNKKNNGDPLPLYKQDVRYLILFCIIGRVRVNVYPLYNKL
jgi:hypothetical protein